MRLAAVLCLVLLLPTIAFAGQFEDGMTAFNRKDYQTALKLWEPLAEHGNSEAQIAVGGLYWSGSGVKQDNAEAFKWLIRAADQGTPNAQWGVGQMYENGEGVSKDCDAALKWYRKSAAQGFAQAQFTLGSKLLEKGKSPKDFEAAYFWLDVLAYNAARQVTLEEIDDVEQRVKRWKPVPAQLPESAETTAAELADAKDEYSRLGYTATAKRFEQLAAKGDPEAQAILGGMYENGLGEREDHTDAAVWYRKAAEQGFIPAEYNLGILLSGKKGPPQDHAEAYFRLRLLASNATKNLTPDQQSAVENRVKNWKPTPTQPAAPAETSKIEKIPHFDSLTSEQFEQQTDLHTATPDGDRYLAYSIRLPKGWLKSERGRLIMEPEGLPRHRKLGLIGRYYAPQTLDISSRIDIITEALSSDFSLHDLHEWLGLTGNGYTILGEEEVNKNRAVVLSADG